MSCFTGVGRLVGRRDLVHLSGRLVGRDVVHLSGRLAGRDDLDRTGAAGSPVDVTCFHLIGRLAGRR